MGTLLINQLKESGAIDEALFSIYISLNDNASKITFGGYELSLFARAK